MLTDQEIYRDGNESEWDDDGIDRSHGLDERCVFAVVQAKRLKGRLKGMVQVKTKDYDYHDVEHRIPGVAEQVDGHMVEVMVTGNRHRPLRGFRESQLYEIEVDEVDHQENKDDDTGVDHILAEKRGMGISLFLIPHRPGQPVLDLHDQAVEDMDDKSTKEYYLKNLDEGVAGHKVDGNLKYLNMVSCQWQDEEVDHQVHNEEGRQKQACNRHDELLGEGGVM